MPDQAYKIAGSCVGALILTVMIGQFHFSWNDSVLMFLALAAIFYFTIESAT